MAQEKEVESLKDQINELYKEIAYLEELLAESDQQSMEQDLAFDEVSREYKEFVENKGVSIKDGIFLSI